MNEVAMQTADAHQSRNSLRVAYLTVNDPHDRTSWSGTEYSMLKSLERHCGEVTTIGPLKIFVRPTIGKIINRTSKMFGGPTYLYTHSVSLSKKLGKMAAQRLARTPSDVIFAPAGSVPLAHLKTCTPIVYLSDTTFHLMNNYYHDFSSLSPRNAAMANEIERLAILGAQRIIYPSAWAARSAVEDYGADPQKVEVVPFGANLDAYAAPTREEALSIHDRSVCRLLFVGTNWERKGGSIALEALTALERFGVRAELTVVGCRPSEELNAGNVRVFPFLNKNDPQQSSQLRQIYHESHFMILPTRAECFSIALCEASAFGLPVLTTLTGGLTELVHEGLNGFLFPLEARGAEYASVLRDVFTNGARYEALRKTSRLEFENRLNWDAWGSRVCGILRAAVEEASFRRVSRAHGYSREAGARTR
jgi:glycosyltransferase involved in cell wall biosynthesis